MTKQNSSSIRLQDLRVFDAILSNGSITAAAEALDLTQSAVSKQLRHLRSYFGDELFVRSGRGMAATAKALAVAPQVSALINGFETLQGEAPFDPGDIGRDFVISTTDEIQHMLLPPLLRRMQAESPRSRVVFRVLERDYAARQLESGTVDLAITLNWHVPEHLKQRWLFKDEFAVIARTGHPLLRRRLTLKRYLEADHMMVSPLGAVTGPIDEILIAGGHRRNVRLAVPYFMQVADALLSSDLLLTLQRRACEQLILAHPLEIAPLPLAIRPVDYFLFWHRRYDKDSTSQWLRQVCAGILQPSDEFATGASSGNPQ